MATMIFTYFEVILMAVATMTSDNERLKNYTVRKIVGDIQITGKGDDPQWQQAEALADFSFPWNDEALQPTVFRALHNDGWLYCVFDVTDANVNIFSARDDKWEVASSSRAEIFLRIDEKLSPYYCLELDPLGRILDYKATYYRTFDGQWSWPEGHLLVKAHQRENGYTVEVAISKMSLRELGLLKNSTLQAGLFRADCSLQNDGKRDFKWASWISPDSPTPDFHIPSSFGVLNLTR